MNLSLANILLVGLAVAFFGFMAYWFFMTMKIDDESAKKMKSADPAGASSNGNSSNTTAKNNKKNRKTY